MDGALKWGKLFLTTSKTCQSSVKKLLSNCLQMEMFSFRSLLFLPCHITAIKFYRSTKPLMIAKDLACYIVLCVFLATTQTVEMSFLAKIIRSLMYACVCQFCTVIKGAKCLKTDLLYSMTAKNNLLPKATLLRRYHYIVNSIRQTVLK